MGDRRGLYGVLVGRHERKRTLGISNPRWEEYYSNGSSRSGM